MSRTSFQLVLPRPLDNFLRERENSTNGLCLLLEEYWVALNPSVKYSKVNFVADGVPGCYPSTFGSIISIPICLNYIDDDSSHFDWVSSVYNGMLISLKSNRDLLGVSTDDLFGLEEYISGKNFTASIISKKIANKLKVGSVKWARIEVLIGPSDSILMVRYSDKFGEKLLYIRNISANYFEYRRFFTDISFNDQGFEYSYSIFIDDADVEFAHIINVL